jgi:hypothetical protein
MKKGSAAAIVNELAEDGNRNELADSLISERTEDGRIVVRVPVDESGGLRELFQMWEGMGFIKVEASEDDMTWIGGVGNVLLWNRSGNIPRGLT